MDITTRTSIENLLKLVKKSYPNFSHEDVTVVESFLAANTQVRDVDMKIFDTFEEVDGMNPCLKRPVIVHFKQINEPFQVNTLEGNYKTGKAGDYLIKGVDEELYIHDKEIFEKVYTRLAPNTQEIVSAIELMEIGDSITFKL